MRRPLLHLVLLLAATRAFAGSGEQDPGRRLVDEFVNNMVTLEAGFEQVLLDDTGAVVERTHGTLEIQRPGRFRWTYTEPYEQWLIADGLNLWSYDVDLAQVTVKPQAAALADTPAMLLGGTQGALDQFDYEGSYEDSGTTWVRLKPKNTDSGFLEVQLGFAKDGLHRMVFRDNLDQTTLVALHDVTVNEPIPAQRFVFTVPEGVDVVGVPAVADAGPQ
ncbi:MAG: outer membrane lipoprotein chaperone LolA [Woeseiaceae bacterium]